MPDTFETGGNPTIARVMRNFDVPDYTEELLQLDDPAQKREPVILKIIEKHKPHRARMLDNYNRFKTNSDGLPIFMRSFERDVEIDNRVNNDYFSEIVNIKTGFFAGKVASYNYDKTESNFETASQVLKSFIERNQIANMNLETTKYCAIAGYSARLVYTDPEDGLDRIMYIPGHNAILLSDSGDITRSRYGIYYYGKEGEYVIEFFDGKTRTKYKQEGGTLKVLVEQRPHNYARCPLVGYANNDELMGDADKVLELIDAIDRTTSDVNSEIEAVRLAYLLVLGYELDQKQIDGMKKTGALSVSGSTTGEKGEVRFLEKNLNDTAVENHLDRLHNAIYRFSSTPNLDDQAFSGQQSGVALRFKLFGLDTKCNLFEQKFRAADMRIFEVLSSKWNISGETFDPYKVTSDFKRNFPMDLLYYADVLLKLKGLVSEQTRLGLAPFIDDVDFEIDSLEEEAAAYAQQLMEQTQALRQPTQTDNPQAINDGGV